jgi:hypothetical protein
MSLKPAWDIARPHLKQILNYIKLNHIYILEIYIHTQEKNIYIFAHIYTHTDTQYIYSHTNKKSIIHTLHVVRDRTGWRLKQKQGRK